MSEVPEKLKQRPGKSAEELREAWDEDEAQQIEEMHWLKWRIEARTRRQQFGDLDGRVLEVACGTGRNFQFLPDAAEIVAVDISTDMLEFARKNAIEFDQQVDLEQMDAQRLAFEDDSFDHVISSLSTCTLPDPIEALNEMGRVCRSSGDIRLLEHHKYQFTPLGKLQERSAEDEYQRIGCRLYDDPTTVVERSDLQVVHAHRWRLPPFTGIVARPSESNK